MNKTAVVYWSGTGNTQAMAEAVAKAAGADLFTAAEFVTDMVDQYKAIAFGCPSMGSEELEDSEFAPMFESCKPALRGKKIALFGSYGWGDGEWMRTWEEDCKTLGADLLADGLILNETPDEAGLEQCRVLGKALAEA
ncbi:MAG TPA: flavodoxin domain-containing protein [Candidatus Limiplasma sp.]|nr:flavodoxin domain-containing protein [Candidatus Limiplasma sp.]